MTILYEAKTRQRHESEQTPQTCGHEYLRRQVRRAPQKIAGKGGVDTRRSGGCHRSECNSNLSLGIRSDDSIFGKVSNNCGNIQYQTNRGLAPTEINQFNNHYNTPIDSFVVFVKISRIKDSVVVFERSAYNRILPNPDRLPTPPKTRYLGKWVPVNFC